MSVLRIYFSSQWRDSTSVCPWALCDESGAILQSGTGTLASIPKAGQCVAILAADRVLFVSARTPPGSRRQWQSALPYLVEGRTLPDPEENHVVLCGTADGGQAHLAVADKAWLRRVVEACRTAGLPLRYAWSEVRLLPHTASGWTLAWNGTTGFVRTGMSSGTALDAGDAETPPAALSLMLDDPELPRPDTIQVRLMPAASGAEAAMPHWQDFPVLLVQGEPWDWRRAPTPSSAGNLLAGEFAPPSRPMEWWPRLRPAAGIALLLLLVEMAGSNLQWAMMAHEQRTLQQQMAGSFRKAFGSQATLVNAPLQMQRGISDLRHEAGSLDSGDFLPLMDLSAAPLARLPLGSIRELYFEGGKLEVMVRINTQQELARLQQSLRTAGLDVHADTKLNGKEFISILTIRPGGAI